MGRLFAVIKPNAHRGSNKHKAERLAAELSDDLEVKIVVEETSPGNTESFNLVFDGKPPSTSVARGFRAEAFGKMETRGVELSEWGNK